MSLSLAGIGLRDSSLMSLRNPGREAEFLPVIGKRRYRRPEEAGKLQRAAAQLERHRPAVGEAFELGERNGLADGDIDRRAEAVDRFTEQQRDPQRIAEMARELEGPGILPREIDRHH